MAEEEKKDTSIESVMAAAWEQTMGEAAQELPEDFTHLGGEPAPHKAEEATAVPQDTQAPTETNSDTQETESVEQTAATTEESTQETESAEAPAHWAEADKATFSKLDAGGKSFLLRRHKEMERDYTRKTQENAEAVRLGSALSRVIDPSIQAELRSTGVTPEQFMENLVGFHRMSSENPVGLIKQLVQILKVDPAQLADLVQNAPQAGSSQDPIQKRFQALESFVESEQTSRRLAAQETATKTIEQVSTEKNADGTPMRPHFEKVRTTMARLMSVDPDLDLSTAYEVAVYRDPELRPSLMQRVAAQGNVVPSAAPVPLDMEKARRGEQAALAAKNVIRGNGKAAPAAPAKGVKMSLSDALNSAADEVGLN